MDRQRSPPRFYILFGRTRSGAEVEVSSLKLHYISFRILAVACGTSSQNGAVPLGRVLQEAHDETSRSRSHHA